MKKILLDIARHVQQGTAFMYSPRGFDYAAIDAALNRDRQSPIWPVLTRAVLSDVLVIRHLCINGVEAGGEAIHEEFMKMNCISLASNFADEDIARAANFALAALRGTGYIIESIHAPIFDADVEQPSIPFYMQVLGVVYPGYEHLFEGEDLHELNTNAFERTQLDLTTLVARAIKTETDEDDEAAMDDAVARG